MRLHHFIAGLLMWGLFACKQNDQPTPEKDKSVAVAPESPTPAAKAVMADAATILARPQVPILCYHQIRDWRGSDSKSARDYIVPVNVFQAQMKLLADSGYHTILPDQLYAYLATGAPLPPKPIMLTYDDTDIDQFEVAAPEMKKYNFKGVFFIMTVSINRRPRYMTREEIKQLSDEGHVIASHTWNHERVPGYKEEKDWTTQIAQPKKKIEEITGKPADYFAYPFGLWNPEAIPQLKQQGIKAAFILSTKRDPADPLFTIRRMIASGHWSAQTTYNSMLKTFAQGK
ncbi:polysaccharide deacetylase family protein [Segetibacter sp. 3557_3]|uniref:polysaccharide deacetylase family protein n=1 Tax=Segetibacter sp. 3557_3 TaxID=2547429 RepID=UPI001058AE82|nr:polysaccharide deacetylase family protein [Segetibacter sp. 3557_3]TDH27250.1 polysaccharide deacetylase family protein [Segetibacter sp. 3557_3]